MTIDIDTPNRTVDTPISFDETTMTRKEFLALEPFNEEKFAKGEKVVLWTRGEATVPPEQKYFKGHPDPVVLRVGGVLFSYGGEYAKQVLRMAPKPKYKTVFDYADDAKERMVWVVVDASITPHEIIAQFGSDDKAKDWADEYAQFLNDVEVEYKKMENRNTEIKYIGICLGTPYRNA